MAARRARARTLRSANWGAVRRASRCAGAVLQRGRVLGASGTDGAAGTDEVGPVELVVLLPSADAATVLLLCELAAELTG